MVLAKVNFLSFHDDLQEAAMGQQGYFLQHCKRSAICPAAKLPLKKSTKTKIMKKPIKTSDYIVL